jgi:hypothetical protein
VIETELAVITFVDNPAMILRRQSRDIAVVPVNTVEQRIERGTQVETAAAPVADFIDAQRFLVQLRGIDRLNEREPLHVLSCHETRRVG